MKEIMQDNVFATIIVGKREKNISYRKTHTAVLWYLEEKADVNMPQNPVANGFLFRKGAAAP